MALPGMIDNLPQEPSRFVTHRSRSTFVASDRAVGVREVWVFKAEEQGVRICIYRKRNSIYQDESVIREEHRRVIQYSRLILRTAMH